MQSQCSQSADIGVRSKRPWRRLIPWLVRGCLTFFFLNMVLGIAGLSRTAASPGALFDATIAADLAGLVLGQHSLHAVADLAACGPAVYVPFSLVVLLGLAGILFLRLSGIVALGLALCLLRLTLRSTGADLRGDLGSANISLLLLALLLYGMVIEITVVRWGLLLRVQGIHLGFLELSRLTLIGVFFNLAIPGAVSGDLLKMAFIARAAPDRKAESVLTIMLDRLIGLLGLFIIASTAVLLALPAILGMGPEYRMAQAGAALVGLGSIGGLAGVVLVELRERLLKLPGVSTLVGYVSRFLPHSVNAILNRFITALELYRSHRHVIAKAVGLALLVHTFLAVDLFIVGRALGEHGLGFQHYFITTQVANAVGGIPVTPGGVGTRDKTAATFFQAFGAAPANTVGSIPVTMSLIIMFWSLVGALVFIASPAARHSVMSGELARESEATIPEPSS